MPRVNLQAGNVTDVAIIGAGPYGLSIAAHLAARGIPFRIFGKPMSAWSAQMPQGMHLKSEGFASSLSHPRGMFTLRDYCIEKGIPYRDTGLPVKLETFVSYGLEFQKRFVPELEEKMVTGLEPAGCGYQLKLEDGEKVLARRVVVATGITPFAQIPAILAELPPHCVTHSSAHSDLQSFRGRRVAVVGAGASAVDLAALLYEAGARVRLIARSSTIRFHDPPRPPSLKERLLRPSTGLGPGLQLFFYVHAPQIFRLLPQELRLDRVHKVLGPAPGWFIKDRVIGRVPFHLGVEITQARAADDGIRLQLTGKEGRQEMLNIDHVIAATGYRVDLGRLAFLSPSLRQRIRLTENAPALSRHFESSVPGLYFAGAAAANTFGPLMRFAYGSTFVSATLAKHLSRPAPHVATLQTTDNAEVFERS